VVSARPPHLSWPPRALPWRWRRGAGDRLDRLAADIRPEVSESIRSQFGQTMDAADIADAITYIVARPRHAAVNEMLICPTAQER
jgi:hypothetical protein